MILSNTRGENSRNAKLNDLKVRIIRWEYDAGFRGKERGKAYGVTAETFNKVGRRQSWSHVK